MCNSATLLRNSKEGGAWRDEWRQGCTSGRGDGAADGQARRLMMRVGQRDVRVICGYQPSLDPVLKPWGSSSQFTL